MIELKIKVKANCKEPNVELHKVYCVFIKEKDLIRFYKKYEGKITISATQETVDRLFNEKVISYVAEEDN